VDERWHIENDLIVCGDLRLAFQRIGVTHWQPRAVLRSWGLAPLHREDDCVCVPCGDGEVLWIGAWSEATGGKGWVSVTDAARGIAGRIGLATGYALTSLGDQWPIDTSAESVHVELAPLTAQSVEIALRVMHARGWSIKSGRPWRALAGPPPLPPRLG
jgi:hypothetical protein